MRPVTALIIALTTALSPSSEAQLRKQDVQQAVRRACRQFQSEAGRFGGYVYFISLDHGRRWGEGDAGRNRVWVQPPATPVVGEAFLRAWEATGEREYLDAATQCARVLVYGQLRSGGWTNSIDMTAWQHGHPYSGGHRRLDGNSSLDDGQTQSALRLVMKVDGALEFRDESIHESAMLGIQSLLNAQFPNGAFPQVWTGPVSSRPVRKASYPTHDWKTEGRIKNYWDMYTLNDNVCGYVCETLITAAEVYGESRCRRAVSRLGDFLLLAQMPNPQPGWAQQYNYNMNPIWARRFEPPAVSGDETQEAIATLIRIAEFTGDSKYLAPIPAALKWLRESELADGQVARYYELRSNRPLYMSRRGREYSLTYDDSRLPAHYGWKTASRVKELTNLYDAAASSVFPASQIQPVTDSQVAILMKSLNEQGQWVSEYRGGRLVGQPKMETGERYLSSEVFSDNVTTLSRYLEQADESQPTQD